jgi:mannitol-1-phosphate 5-dehydrogenase
MATAVPNVSLYTAGGAASIASVLARNLHPDKPRILYAAENDNYAAERLDADVRALSPADGLGRFQILNTVIGKMSGVIRDPAVLVSLGLAPLTPSLPRAVLVEEFNRILVSKVSLAGFRRGIAVFDEKPDLLPFEEAKLFGHNAVHALLGYMACLRGYRVMSEIRDDPDLLAFGRLAFVAESGEALVRKHGPTGDPLFTPEGYAAYADDLLRRMTNPFLHDEVERVCRDPVRKLGPNDRLVGAMREALRQGIEPRRMARGGAAALRFAADRGLDLGPGVPSPSSGGPLGATAVRSALRFIWGSSPWDAEREQCARLIAEEEMHLEEGGS